MENHHCPSSFQKTHYYYIKYESPFDSDEFKMFNYKVDLCPRNRSHDWTSCPYAHIGERARRRDPVLYNYAPFPCPNEDNCEYGNACGFAHGTFEYWLHPAKYRTRPCRTPGECDRRVCFFAHKPSELRREAMYKWYCIYKPYFGLGVDATGIVTVPAGERTHEDSLVLSQAPAMAPISGLAQLPGSKVIRRGDTGDIGSTSLDVSNIKTVGVWDMGFDLDLGSCLAAGAGAGARQNSDVGSSSRQDSGSGPSSMQNSDVGSSSRQDSSSDPHMPDLNWVFDLVDE
ncbi:hypothetical protein LguiB_029270 [Lonicera macranthoides]